MGQDADRPRQTEKPPCQGCGTAQLGIDDRRGPIDVECHGLAPFGRQMRADGACNICETARDCPRSRRLINQRQKPRRAGIDGFVEPMAKSGEIGAMLRAPILQRTTQIIGRIHRMIERHRLFPRAPMHIAQQVQPRGHRRLQPHATGGSHARGGNRRGLRPMIDRRDQRRLEQGRTRAFDLIPHDHQPDHRRKADIADQILHRMAAQADPPRLHLDDGSAPPIGDIGILGQITPSARRVWICSAS